MAAFLRPLWSTKGCQHQRVLEARGIRTLGARRISKLCPLGNVACGDEDRPSRLLGREPVQLLSTSHGLHGKKA